MGLTLQVMSDLHVEFRSGDRHPMPRTGADVVVLAGDIHGGAKAIPWARRQFPDQEILYVAGNHEFYGGTVPSTLLDLRRMARKFSVRFLHHDAEVIGGVRFLGCTLWTDFGLFGEERRDAAMRASQQCISDFREIRPRRLRDAGPIGYVNPPVTPFEVRAWHLKSRAWLEHALAEPCDGPTVVVTHHLPHPRSLPEAEADDPASAAYASNLQHLFGRMVLWIHGHAHQSSDYRLDGTRVLCNPRGYPAHTGADENRAFDPCLTVTV